MAEVFEMNVNLQQDANVTLHSQQSVDERFEIAC